MFLVVCFHLNHSSTGTIFIGNSDAKKSVYYTILYSTSVSATILSMLPLNFRISRFDYIPAKSKRIENAHSIELLLGFVALRAWTMARSILRWMAKQRSFATSTQPHHSPGSGLSALRLSMNTKVLCVMLTACSIFTRWLNLETPSRWHKKTSTLSKTRRTTSLSSNGRRSRIRRLWEIRASILAYWCFELKIQFQFETIPSNRIYRQFKSSFRMGQLNFRVNERRLVGTYYATQH